MLKHTSRSMAQVMQFEAMNETARTTRLTKRALRAVEKRDAKIAARQSAVAAGNIAKARETILAREGCWSMDSRERMDRLFAGAIGMRRFRDDPRAVADRGSQFMPRRESAAGYFGQSTLADLTLHGDASV